ncbi:MAG: cytochrome c-type biogenesis protein CcmH [Chromatiaceae bacterium]|nr:cytochrome c-type biogenesis protein CcmH [Gammaproteobacteria bacterium]MCP5318046.1 cytochrome c-type biogenesis protein CcmH [Chromatiaceae bacterium]MCW5584731.1 cytochrome c-type biogenesis protein CcmH [Chromatiales bacterium]MCB1817558.1 cytochrome c-type biogenesis protein CcmH [Gammaproteobacteria bacterium]MCP5415121.1 cytochrome c-type biogenesis protein CcmH [Chromatiaceae bacterium]
MTSVKSMFFVAALLLAVSASARVEVHNFEGPEQEARYNKLIAELRCLVCQNQNLADSNAELAVDLRRKTYEMVKQDKSEGEIVDYMVDRYGEFVLYRPRLTNSTLLLWAGPFIILVIGISLLIRTVRRRRAGQDNNIDDASIRNAAALLDTDRDKRNA